VKTGDTIAAISTPVGEGAIAVIRVSGPDALTILGGIFQTSGPWPGDIPRTAVFGRIRDDDALVDHVLATAFPGPGSYTGENVFEVACHGGILLAAKVLELTLRRGARQADPGEFTYRAFLNGKIDLTRAEAVMDIIRARTPLALRAAAEQLDGSLGKEILALREEVLHTVAQLEAWIDFPEEGIDAESGEKLAGRISRSIEHIRRLLATADDGRILREGVRVAIAGAPNVGKSSLLNRLLGTDRAIVSSRPGTTRDTIEETACFHGILFRLTDTAGLRDTEDPVERDGVARSRRTLNQADLVLHVTEAPVAGNTASLSPNEILVVNKVDLLADRSLLPPASIAVSSLTGEGIPALIDTMTQRVGLAHLAAAPSLASINARHRALLESAENALSDALELTLQSGPPELAAFGLRAALDSIGRIAGSADIEEILGEIFSQFCIGK
jgi:tRNA modification GTPase